MHVVNNMKPYLGNKVGNVQLCFCIAASFYLDTITSQPNMLSVCIQSAEVSKAYIVKGFNVSYFGSFMFSTGI